MICRHTIAPTRAFTQLSNELIRHPRLTSDAVRLLTWQLSLPDGARENLSRTAERANINNSAFTRAKAQLKAEGFVHERRVQGPGGRWFTQQLVSSTPLSPEQAAKLMARDPSPQVAPSRPYPAVGQPTTRPTDGHPSKDDNTRQNTPDLPTPPEEPEPEQPEPEQPQPEPTPPAEATAEAARALTATYRFLDPALLHIPRAMTAELATLTARWLEAGHSPGDVRTHIVRGLPTDGTPVRHPGGLLRYLLSEVPPPRPAEPSTDQAADQDAGNSGPRLSARLAALRECEGPNHTQAHLFRPAGDEILCPNCAPAA